MTHPDSCSCYTCKLHSLQFRTGPAAYSRPRTDPHEDAAHEQIVTPSLPPPRHRDDMIGHQLQKQQQIRTQAASIRRYQKAKRELATEALDESRRARKRALKNKFIS